MIELVFFGMIGLLGLWMREVHNSRKPVAVKKTESELMSLRKLRVRMHIRNK